MTNICQGREPHDRALGGLLAPVLITAMIVFIGASCSTTQDSPETVISEEPAKVSTGTVSPVISEEPAKVSTGTVSPVTSDQPISMDAEPVSPATARFQSCVTSKLGESIGRNVSLHDQGFTMSPALDPASVGPEQLEAIFSCIGKSDDTTKPIITDGQ